MARQIKHALVLSGGGFKGAFQIGALDYLREQGLVPAGLKFDLISGVSAGSLNGAMIAAGQYPALQDIWQRIAREGHEVVYTSEFINQKGEPEINAALIRSMFFPNYRLRIGLLEGLRLLLFKKRQEAFLLKNIDALVSEAQTSFSRFQAIASNQPLADILEKHLHVSQIPPETIFTCGFVSLIDGRYYNPKHTEYATPEDFRQAVLASSAIPIIWEPVPVVNTKDSRVESLMDGGLKNSSPLGDVLKLIEQDQDNAIYKILIINNNSGVLEPERKPLNIAQIALRTLTEITLTEIFNNDLSEFIRINALVSQAEAQGVTLKDRNGERLKKFYYKIIQPQGEELGGILDARSELIEKRYETGRQRAKEVFGKVADPHWPDEATS